MREHIRRRVLTSAAVTCVLVLVACAAAWSAAGTRTTLAALRWAGRGWPAAHRTVVTTTTSPKTSTTAAPTTTTVPPTTAVPTTAAPTTTAPPPPPPVWAGKGMWIYQPLGAEGGDGHAIVARAAAEGISTVFVRTGSSHDGLTMGWVLDLLPIAHAAGLRVVGWDFPELDDVTNDVLRAVAAINATAVDGSRLDGFTADIETTSEGVNLTSETVTEYGTALRSNVPGYPLIACVPNPSPHYQTFYPYAEAVAAFDAVAPMVYWMGNDPATDVSDAIGFLARFGKPVAPVGQAFNGALAGGEAGMPGITQLAAFAGAAAAEGAAGISFWSWQHADDDVFAAIGMLPKVGMTS